MVVSYSAAGTQPVNRYTPYAKGVACQQQAHAGHVSVIFSALVCRTSYHLLYGIGWQAGVPLQDVPQHMGQQVVWAYAAEATPISANGGAQGIHNVGFLHGCKIGKSKGPCRCLRVVLYRPITRHLYL